jgi:hypothetical protein
MKESNQEDSKQHNLILKQQAVPNTIVDPNNLDLFYNQTNFDNFTIATFRGNSQVFNALFPQTYGGI